MIGDIIFKWELENKNTCVAFSSGQAAAGAQWQYNISFAMALLAVFRLS